MSNWMIKEDKLSDEQRQFINEEIPKNKNQWIRGFAGCGKSVLLIHGIHDLIRKNPNIQICIVVFTHSLKQLFDAGIKELKIPEKKGYKMINKAFKSWNSEYKNDNLSSHISWFISCAKYLEKYDLANKLEKESQTKSENFSDFNNDNLISLKEK